MWLWEVTDEVSDTDEPAAIHATSLAFTPDGRRLATHSWDGQVEIWEPPQPDSLCSVDDNGHADHKMVFSPDGTRLLVVGQGVGYYHVNVEDGGRLEPMDPPWAEYGHLTTGAAFSADGRYLFLADTHRDMGAVNLYDLKTFEEKESVVTNPVGRAGPLALGSTGLVATGTNPVLLWPLGTGRQKKLSKRAVREARRLVHRGEARALAFSPDGRCLAAAADEVVVRWEAATGRELKALAGHEGVITALAFHPEGRLLASAGEDGTVRFWDGLTDRCVRALRWPLGKVKDVAFSPDGMRAAACGTSGRLVLWDVDEEPS